MVTATALLCLALNVYFEARSEPVRGQKAVANVTLNRAKNDKRAVCSVVFSPKQFSWTNSLNRKHNLVAASLRKVDQKSKAWKLALRISKDALAGRVKVVRKDVTHYHTVAVAPVWSKGMRLVAVIGTHRFYTTGS